jgi:flagellar biosynthesis protein FlhB
MALFGDDQGKTEKPTPTRLAEVRDRGDVPLSRELLQGGVLLVAAVMLAWTGGWLLEALAKVMRRGLDVDLDGRSVGAVSGACRELWDALSIVGPPLAVLVSTLVAATLVIGYGQIGLHWASKVLGFKFERLNPIANWKRVFNVQALVRTAFAVVKLALLIGVLWLCLGDRIPALLHLHEAPIAQAGGEIADLALTVMLWTAATVTALAAADHFYQRWSFEQRNMMTKQEVEDERKRSEGDPAIKGRQRRARNELLKQRMMTAVPKADVIVTNPTHFAVALRYDRKRDSAPVVVAKGVDEMALQIRNLAKQHGVPLMEDPPLARALFRAVKVGQAIPEKFYQAVATVLGHVFRLQSRSA